MNKSVFHLNNSYFFQKFKQGNEAEVFHIREGL